MKCNSQPLSASSKPLSVIRRHPKGRSVSGWKSNKSFEFFELKESSQAPRIPSGRGGGSPWASKIGPKSIQKSIKMLMSFWSRFGRLLGPFWPPFWSLLGAQIGPRGSKTHLETSFLFKKVDVHEITVKPTPKSKKYPRRVPRSAQDGLKTLPRRS